MHKSIALALAGAFTVVSLGAVAGASAAQATTSFNTSTFSPEHPDTTSVSGTATEAGPGGPIWANDSLKEFVTVTSAGEPGHYNVRIGFGGSTFQGFADPRANGEAGSNGDNAGGPLFSQGKISGTIHYNDITSSNPPQALPATQVPDTGLGAVLNELFNNGITAGAVTTHYNINYTQNPAFNGVDPTGNTTDNPWVAGVVYNQTG